jgi:F-type H+-transporting ATPase subunit b
MKRGFVLLPGQGRPRLGVLVLLACLAGPLVSPGRAQGQGNEATSSQRKPDKARQEHPGPARELVEGSREAAGEDETAEFKQSGSVQVLARITGLSLQHAYWLGVTLNFAIVAGLIYWFGKKYLPGFFQGRTAAIQKAMADARRESEEANRRLSDIEARLGRLDTEIAAMRETAEKDAAAEEERIRAAAADDVRKVVETAEQEIVAAAKLARRELTAYAADLAVALATRQMHVDTATDEALVRGFSRQLSGDGGPRKDGR